MALLGTVLVTALVLGLAAWGILNMTGTAQRSVYGENAANQARTAALMGIQAVTGYAQSVYLGATPPTSASLSNLSAPALSQDSGLVDQTFTQPTNANVQTMIVANTFSSTGTGTGGFIKMLSTGRSGSSIQTAEAYLTAQNSTLRNNNYSVILGGNATLNGGIKNNSSSQINVGVGPNGNIKIHGTTINGNTITGPTYIHGENGVVFDPISSLPIINPNGLEQYSTIQLVNGVVTIPANAVDFYIKEGFLSNASVTSSTNSYHSYQCCPNGNNCAENTNLSQLPLCENSAPNPLPISFSSTSDTWSIGKIPAFIYSDQAVNVTATGTEQLTIASIGTITTNSNVILYPFGVIPSENTALINACGVSTSLPICNDGSPYLLIQGLIYVTSGNDNIGESDSFYGDIASVGALTVNGGGSETFAGTTIAEGGYTNSNGILPVSSPVAAANSATLGGYQLTASSIRWVP
jgi:hypothetical protein